MNAPIKHIRFVNATTREWTIRAICSECSMCYPDGMPDKCAYGHQGCTDIIQRDKSKARGES